MINNQRNKLTDLKLCYRLGAPTAELIGIRLPKLSTPRAHGFVCQ